MCTPPLSRPALGVATFALAAALGLASLLAWHTLAGQPLVVGCGGPTADCEAVTATRWAYWGPVPVILPAVALYLALLGGLLALEPLRAAGAAGWEWLVWRGLATGSLIVLGAAGWFVAVQGLVLRRYCPLCLTTHLCACLGGLLTLRLTPKGVLVLGRRWWLTPPAVTAGTLAWLAGGQLVLPPRAASNLPSFQASVPSTVSVISRVFPSRELVLVSGRVRLDAAAYPALVGGSSVPAQTAVILFDYTCAACRSQHATLLEAVRRRPGGLTLLLVPTPLDPACNPAVERLRPEHVNACLYARYALAVWKAAPERFAAYDAWLMAGGSEPPHIEEARRRAEATVGKEAFGRALAQPDLERALHNAGGVYQRLEAGEIPKLLLPRAMFSGNLGSLEQLEERLTVQLGKPAGSARW